MKMNTYLVGNQKTIADILITGALYPLYRLVFDEKFRKTITNVTRWFEQVASIPEFIKYFGKMYYCKVEWELEELKTTATVVQPVVAE